MHWTDRIAKSMLRRGKRHTIASGISISGHIHIGHCNDVFIADAIRRSVREAGGSATAFWYADDFDPMRRVPWPLPKEYEQYLGVPYIDIPSPDSKYENFVEFFSGPFLGALDDFGIKARVYSGAELYRSGKFAGVTRVALKNADKIRAILNRYREEPLPEDWLPYDAVCGKCGRLATTRSYDWSGNIVKYKCEDASYVKGCGHDGEADYTKGEGKLTWRAEWPARWKLLRVTCEPFGKDHAAAGGSYETGKLIAKKVFDYEPPTPVPYEWVSLHGKPMSSSKGRVFTLPQWLDLAEPEMLRHFIFRSKAMKAKDFDPGLPLLDLYDEYDNLEDIYFGRVKVRKTKEAQVKRIYEVSQVKTVPKHKPQRISFRLAAILCQVAGDTKHAIKILKSKGLISRPTKLDTKLLARRLNRALDWVDKYAPERFKLEVLETLPEEIKHALTDKQRRGLEVLADDLSTREYDSVEIHNRVYEVARGLEIKPGELFGAIYLVLLGRKFGPRAGSLISALERDLVIRRFRTLA